MTPVSKRSIALRLVAHTVYGLALLLMALLSGNKYRWMSELDESIAVGAIEDASNNSAVFAMLLLALTLTIQLVLFFKSRNATQRVTAAMLMGLALAVWVTKVLA